MRKITIIFLFSFLSILSKAQSTFYSTVLGWSIPYEVKTRATPDGGWVLCGTSNSGIRMVKFDKCGTVEWCNDYSSSQTINVGDFLVSKSGGYAVAGYLGNSFAADVYLMRIDASGNVIFAKGYTDGTSEHTYSVGEDNFGNFFINGNTNPGGTGLGNNFIIKTDHSGNILWSNLYALGGMWARSLVTSDNCVLRCGGHGDIYKVDGSGNVLWVKYGYWHARHEPIEVSDGYVFPSYNSSRGYLFKIAFDGDPLWYTPQYSTSYGIQRVAESATGSLVVASSAFTIEFEKNGTYLNHQRYVRPNTMSGPSITDLCRLSDNSYALTGLDAGGALNMKINPSLRSGCADTAIALDTIPVFNLNIRDTAGYYAGPKAFATVNLNITINNFTPVIQEYCQNIDSVQLSSSIPDSVCGGDVVVLSSINSSVSWYSDGCGNNLVGTGNSVSVFLTSSQTYYARTEGCDTSACKQVSVNVKLKPNASFNSSYFVTCNGVRADLTNQSTNADSYIWNFSDGSSSTEYEPSHTFSINSVPSVYLIASNNNSCSDTTSVDSTFIYNLPDFFNLMLPNVFTPNNDGINDEYGLTLKSDMPDCFSLLIFDRWGVKMFDSKVSGTSWDGRTSSGVKAVSGVYFCVLKINDYEFTGEINLLE